MDPNQLNKNQNFSSLTPMDDATFAAQIKASFAKSTSERYRNMMGNCWMPPQMWHPNQMMRTMDPKLQQKMGQQMHPKNYMMYPVQMNPQMPTGQQMQMNPQMPLRMGHQLPLGQKPPMNPQMPMGQPMGLVQQMPMRIAPQMMMGQKSPISQANEHKSPIQSQVPISQVGMPPQVQMGQRIPVGGMIQVKSPQPIKMGHLPPNLIHVKSPIIPTQPFLNVPKYMPILSPEGSPDVSNKAEPMDPEVELRKEIISIMDEEIKKIKNLYDVDFSYKDPDSIVDTMVTGFEPILDLLWDETKKSHEYSLDSIQNTLNQMDNDSLEVEKDFSPLEEFYEKKKEIEEIMTSYRTNTRYVQQESSNSSRGFELDLEVQESLNKAMEYANVACNQRQLLNKITSLDYRNALNDDVCIRALPKDFRLKLIQMINTLHFDLDTPPQSVSPKVGVTKDTFSGVESILSKCYNTLAGINFPAGPNKAKGMPGMPPGGFLPPPAKGGLPPHLSNMPNQGFPLILPDPNMMPYQ